MSLLSSVNLALITIHCNLSFVLRKMLLAFQIYRIAYVGHAQVMHVGLFVITMWYVSCLEHWHGLLDGWMCVVSFRSWLIFRMLWACVFLYWMCSRFFCTGVQTFVAQKSCRSVTSRLLRTVEAVSDDVCFQFVTWVNTCISLCLWLVCSKMKMITSHCMMVNSSQLLLGTDGGSIHVFDTETFTLADKVVFQDLILQK